MPGLTPRADLTDTYKIIAIAFLLSACIYFQNSHYQPVAGDNLHRLPFWWPISRRHQKDILFSTTAVILSFWKQIKCPHTYLHSHIGYCPHQ